MLHLFNFNKKIKKTPHTTVFRSRGLCIMKHNIGHIHPSTYTVHEICDYLFAHFTHHSSDFFSEFYHITGIVLIYLSLNVSPYKSQRG